MPGGRPTVYDPEFAETARTCCMMGATNPDLAERFEVSRSTIDRWIAGIPDFRDAVRQGRDVADGKVASALFRRAVGMMHETTKAFCHDGKPVTVSYAVELPPDVRACMFWLRNRRPEQWNESRRQEKPALAFSDLEEASRRVAERNNEAAVKASQRDEAETDLHGMAQRLDVHL